MTILGIGVDLVHIPRIAAVLGRRGPSRLAARILSQEEAVEWELLPSDTTTRLRFLAVRWGIKEAAYKAMYPTIKTTWKELTYRGLSEGRKPMLSYHPVIPGERLRIGQMHISVSHDGDFVFASVLIENPTLLTNL